MSAQTISHFIIEYRYLILIPLALIEGPIVAFIAGTLASLHYFNIYALAAFFFVRDIGLDSVYYCIGYFGGHAPFVKRMLKKIGITEDDLERLRNTWEEHPARTMFIGKLSYGIAQVFIVVAGTVEMPYLVFLGYGALVAVAQYGTLLLLGYFFGNTFGGSLSTLLGNIQYVIAIFAGILSLYYIFSWYMRKRFLKQTAGHGQILK
jgi:membrane-associated protein